MNMNRLFTCLCLSLLFNLAQAQLPIPEYQKGKAIFCLLYTSRCV